mmetsp:Transcript_33368/g.75382  ORF Transcript_33368/g.75382 Transcript_33368/m.75382 type:complete len:202 (-) Transcript_33368:397-1002(-)
MMASNSLSGRRDLRVGMRRRQAGQAFEEVPRRRCFSMQPEQKRCRHSITTTVFLRMPRQMGHVSSMLMLRAGRSTRVDCFWGHTSLFRSQSDRPVVSNLSRCLASSSRATSPREMAGRLLLEGPRVDPTDEEEEEEEEKEAAGKAQADGSSGLVAPPAFSLGLACLFLGHPSPVCARNSLEANIGGGAPEASKGNPLRPLV